MKYRTLVESTLRLYRRISFQAAQEKLSVGRQSDATHTRAVRRQLMVVI